MHDVAILLLVFMGVSKQRNGVMRNEKQRNGMKTFIKGGDNTSFIVNRIFL